MASSAKPATRDRQPKGGSRSNAEVPDAPPIPYQIIYPTASQQKQKQRQQDNVHFEHHQFDPKLNRHYLIGKRGDPKSAVFPEWRELREYESLGIEDSQGREITLKRHDLVYVQAGSENKSQRSSDDDTDMRNHWPAQILEIRSPVEEGAFVRLWWFYRPEELPGGLLPEHAENEVFPSDHMDIIDASSIDDVVSSIRRVYDGSDDKDGEDDEDRDELAEQLDPRPTRRVHEGGKDELHNEDELIWRQTFSSTGPD